MRVGRIEGLEGPLWASRLHMSSVFEEGRKWLNFAGYKILAKTRRMGPNGPERRRETPRDPERRRETPRDPEKGEKTARRLGPYITNNNISVDQ